MHIPNVHLLTLSTLSKMATDRQTASKIGVVKPFGVCRYNVNVNDNCVLFGYGEAKHM